MNLIGLNDYVLYRLCMAYKDGKEPPVSYATMLVSVIQTFTIMTSVAAIKLLTHFSVDVSVYAIIGIILMVTNALRYERKSFDFMKLHERWKDENKTQRKIRGVLIVTYMILVIGFPFLFGFLRHNLGVI